MIHLPDTVAVILGAIAVVVILLTFVFLDAALTNRAATRDDELPDPDAAPEWIARGGTVHRPR